MSDEPLVGLVTPSGEAGFRQVEALRAALAKVAAERPRRVVLNLSRLDFISSAGMGVLVSFKHALARDGASLTLAAVPPHVFDVLHAAGLYKRPRPADGATDANAATHPVPKA